MDEHFFLGFSEEGFHRIAYTEWGSNDRHPPIICVHGVARNSRDFDSLAGYLSEHGHHVFCPDIVGRGESDWLKNPLHYTYEQYMADMSAMIARTQKNDVTWLGTSMGGLIGMALAAYANSPIKRLILNDVGPQIPMKALTRLSQYVGLDPDFSSVIEAKNYYKNLYQHIIPLNDEEWTHFAKHSIREVSPQKFVPKMDRSIKLFPMAKSKFAWRALSHPLKALEGNLFDINLWDIFRKITCPILVIHGTHSDILLPSTLSKMQSIHQDITVIEVPDTGHAPLLQHTIHQEMILNWLNEKY